MNGRRMILAVAALLMSAVYAQAASPAKPLAKASVTVANPTKTITLHFPTPSALSHMTHASGAACGLDSVDQDSSSICVTSSCDTCIALDCVYNTGREIHQIWGVCTG